MTKVDFEFMPGDKVRTKLGDIGFVTTCSIDEAGTKFYFIEQSHGRSWCVASSLKKVEEDVK